MPETEPLLIDYHCHLDLYPNFEEQFLNCTVNRIATLAVTTTPLAWPKNKELAATSPMVRVGLGIHPHMVGLHPSELALFEKYLPETRFVGEVGLDAGPAYYKTYGQQKVVFERIIRLCAQSSGKILSVHAVRSARDVLNLVEVHLAGTKNRVVLHWFSGSEAEARRAVELGCYFSINGAMLLKPTSTALIDKIPRQRLLTETDGPFTKTASRPTEPRDVFQTTEHLAKLLGLNNEKTRTMLRSNLATLERTSSDKVDGA
jgi:TatD DNase family protein